MRDRRHIRLSATIVSSLLAISALADGRSAGAAAPAPDDDLHLALNLGMWGTAASGTAGIGRFESDVDVDFDEIISHTNFAAMGGLELDKSNWVLDFNGMYAHLDDSTTGALGRDVEVEADMGIADLALGYTLLRTEMGTMPLTLTPAVGARYTNIGNKIEIGNLPSLDDSRQWVDPYVGGRIVLGLTDALAWRTEGTIGGTNETDTIWSAATYLDWTFAKSWILNVGYRAVNWNYDQNGFEWQMTIHGPWLGLTWQAF